MGKLGGREKLDPSTLSEEEIVGAYHDFRNFLWITYASLGLNVDPLTMDIARHVQESEAQGGDIFITSMRGIGKSYICNTYVVWKLWRNHDELFVVVSGSENKALEFIAFAKNIIDLIPFLHHLRPIKGKGEVEDSKALRWSKDQFDVADRTPSQAPSCRAVGIEGNMTGSRGTTIIADDIETEKNSKTVLQRDKIKANAREFMALVLPGGRRIYLGTPQTADTVYREVCKTVRTQVWPARFPSMVDIEEKYPNLAPYIKEKLLANPKLVGTSTVPERFSDAHLENIEMRNGKWWFQLHYMCDPTLSDENRYPLKLRNLIVTSCDKRSAPNRITWSRENIRKDLESAGFSGDFYVAPGFIEKELWLPYSFKIMAIDPSGKGADETGVVILGELNTNMFLLEMTGLNGDYQKTIAEVAQMAKSYEVNEIVVETNFGDGMYEELLKAELKKIKYTCAIESVRVTSVQGTKEQRICNVLEPIIDSHRLIVDETVIRKNNVVGDQDGSTAYNGFFQMSRITRDRGALTHEDRLDALAIGVSRFIEIMGRTQEDEANKEDMNRAILFAENFAFMLRNPLASKEQIEYKQSLKNNSEHSNNVLGDW